MGTDVPQPTTGEQLLLDLAVEEAAPPTRVSVVDDETGALTAGTLALFPAASIRLHCDLAGAEAQVRSVLPAERADVTVAVDLADAVAAGTDLVLFTLPKSLDALDELARTVATHAAPGVTLIGLGRVKHLNRSMNDVLGRSFGAVRGSRGRGKYRALIATGPQRATGPAGPEGSRDYPKRSRDAELDLVVCAHGAAFAGTKVDRGTRLLLSTRADWPEADRVLDLGCGTGVLAAIAARRQPSASVLGVDESAAACSSARATAEANGLDDRISVRRAADLAGVADHSLGLILCNPPFHVGTAKDSTPALAMFDEAARTLAPDGELWTVFNTHLPYRQALRAAVGPTGIVTQDASYLVTRSRPR